MMRIPGLLSFGFLMILSFHLSAEENSMQYNIRTDSVPVNMLIINSFDAMSNKSRKNKKELFRELADSLKQVLYESSPPPNGGLLIVIPELINEKADSDSTILLLMIRNNASKAIVIITLDAFFNQTDVEVTKDAGGKNRTASFDICARISYRLYNSGVMVKDSEITNCEFYTKRNVMSGLLAAGPDIVGKKREAFKIVRKNALEYLSRESPWK